MSHYVLRLIITLAHDYFDGTDIPVKVQPSNPELFDKYGLIIKRRGNQCLVVAEENAPMPENIAFDVLATDAEMANYTRHMNVRQIFSLSMPDAVEEVTFGPPHASSMPERMTPPQMMATLSVETRPDDLREVTLRFEAVEAFWAYHFVGQGNLDDLLVVDPADEVVFRAEGRSRLPDGRAAQVIRSDVALPARARPTQKFMLQRSSAFGPETLMPVLPAAGRSFKPIPTDGSAATRLQSDIFVTLW